jgi:AcrR family transcriptional regulator
MSVAQRRAREIENLRRAILDAARELFAQEDFKAVSLRKIAKKVEYSPAAIYRYFNDKEEILYHLIDEGFQMLLARFEELQSIPDPVERLRRGGVVYTQFALAEPNYYRLMFQLEKNEMMSKYMPQCTAAHSTFGFVVSAVNEAMEMGIFKPEPSALIVAASIWAGLHGAVSLVLTGHLHIMVDPAADEILFKHVTEGLIKQNLVG